MKIKKLILGLSSIGLLATVAPISSMATSQITFADSQNEQNLDIAGKLTEVQSINKSCEKLLTYDLKTYYDDDSESWKQDISNIDSRVKIGYEHHDSGKEGKIERDDLFTCDRTDSQYTSYSKYEPNNIGKSNTISYGNAKKYKLDVTVPAYTKEYKVQIVANCKIENFYMGGLFATHSFAQAKLSQLSTYPQETLMKYIGIKDNNVYRYNNENLKITTANDLFTLFKNSSIYSNESYTTATLSSTITLSNETYRSEVIPVYFWYGFFGGGYFGPGSYIKCSEVTFSAKHVTSACSQLDVDKKLTEVKSINKSCEKLVTFNAAPNLHQDIDSDEKKYFFNVDSRVKIEDGNETDVKEGKVERDNLFTCERTDTQYTSYNRYKSNNVEKNNHTSWGNAKKYQLNVTVPANTNKYKVQVVADVKIKNCLEGWIPAGTFSFAQAKLSPLSTNPQAVLMPYIGIKDDIEDNNKNNNLKITTQNDLFRLFYSSSVLEKKPYETATLSSAITLSNNTPEIKVIPVYFWYGFFGGGYKGTGHGSHINCSEVTFSANHIE